MDVKCFSDLSRHQITSKSAAPEHEPAGTSPSAASKNFIPFKHSSPARTSSVNHTKRDRLRKNKIIILFNGNEST